MKITDSLDLFSSSRLKSFCADLVSFKAVRTRLSIGLPTYKYKSRYLSNFIIAYTLLSSVDVNIASSPFATLSKEDQKRLKIIDNFYKEKITTNSFTEKNLNKYFYYHGKQSVIDILSYRLFHMKKIDKKLYDYIDEFQSKISPIMPVNAKFLMDKYNFSEGKNIGIKLKDIEEEWIKNNFNLTNKQIDKIISR